MALTDKPDYMEIKPDNGSNLSLLFTHQIFAMFTFRAPDFFFMVFSLSVLLKVIIHYHPSRYRPHFKFSSLQVHPLN